MRTLKNLSLIFALSFLFLGFYTTQVSENIEIKPYFGYLESGSFTKEEILKQDKIRISINGVMLEENEVTIVSFGLLSIPPDSVRARLGYYMGGDITSDIKRFVTNASVGDRVVLFDVKYKRDGLEEKELKGNVNMLIVE